MIGGEVVGMAKSKVMVLGFLSAAILVAMVLGAARPAHARTFTVDTTADLPDPSLGDDVCVVSIFGGCSLRAAIQQANATDGADAINFNIAGGSKTISPTSELPGINEALTINGYSQPGASANTLTTGNNANLLIELNGTDAGDFSDGLGTLSGGSNVVIKGLVINRFGGTGIAVHFGSGNRVEGNFIGTNRGGTQAQGNSFGGVFVFNCTNNTIGGASPAARNLISGNGSQGVHIFASSSANKVLSNYIGTDRNGTGSLGNASDGVLIRSSDDNIVGGADAGAANLIRFNNSGSGVEVRDADSTGNRILANSIFSNGGSGIDLGVDGRTANDLRDPDKGPNKLQNFPALTSAATSTSSGKTTVTGALNSTPNTTIAIRFFSNPPNTDEGHKFVGQKNVTTDGEGNAAFTFVAAGSVPAGKAVTATATGPSGTSEFSDPLAVSSIP